MGHLEAYMPIIWLALAIIFAITEGVSVQLVSIWLAIASVITAALAALGLSLPLQIVVFLVVTFLLLALTRPVVKRLLHTKRQSTNADQVIGKTAIVRQAIDNDENTGRVYVMGLEWKARSLTGEKFRKEQKVRIQAIEGVTLIVEAEPVY